MDKQVFDIIEIERGTQMNNIIKTTVAVLGMLMVTGCNKTNVASARLNFGDFSYHGIFLKEYATKQITVDQAKQLVDITPNMRKTSRALSNNVQTVLTKYASMNTIVKYYISDREEQQVRKDIYQGTDFKSLLESNHYEPFGQMSVKFLFVDDDLLDDMEVQNNEFKESESHIISPFNDPYTYHTDENNKLILQTHNFAELPSSTGGGIGSTFRQDCELLFDEEGKITHWQSSLGLYTSTPSGTVREGYIFEVEFEWVSK